MKEERDITELLRRWSNGEQAALDTLMPIVYQELRRLAINRLSMERSDHTLQATALVHEAYIRLIDIRSGHWENRTHFFAIAAHIMRNILVDHARSFLTEKRGAGRQKLSLEETRELSSSRDIDLLSLDDALNSLVTIDLQQSRIVELRYFGGLTIEETAEILQISPATVKREWILAKAWLLRELSRS